MAEEQRTSEEVPANEGYTPDDELAGQLRQIREEVRQEVGLPQPKMSRQQEQGYLYGDRDLTFFPQLQQHLAEIASLYAVREQPFRSNLPLVGPLIAWFRERWNRISTKWYVQPILEQQVRFNAAVVAVLQDLRHYHQLSSLDVVRRMDALFDLLDQAQAGINARIVDLQAGQGDLARQLQARLAEIQDLSHWVQELQQRTGDQGWQILALQEQQRQQVHQQTLDRRALAFTRAEVDRLMAQLAGGRRPTSTERAEIEQRREALQDHDYFRFEERYRPEAVVREGQKIYLPFFADRRNVLDLGCGKGEFLEVLRAEGIEAYGVDLNEPMVQASREKGLLAIHADALEHMAGLPDNSLGGLFAAHLVEHLPLRALVQLVQLALAKLEPEAYLILETPNPLCLWALVNYFYMDLSHVKPIHPQALSFLLEMHGFRDLEVRFLHPVPAGVPLELLPAAPSKSWQETIARLNQNLQRLNDLLYGYSDYAVIARK